MQLLHIKKRNKKRKAWELRENGFVPGSIYGKTIDSTPIRIPKKELKTALKEPGELYKVETVLGPRFVKFIDIHKDPVTREIIHFSLVELPRDRENKVEIPVKLEGTPKGVKNGGVLVVLKDSLNVYGMVEDIPEKIEENIKSLKIGETLTVDDLEIEEDIEIEEKDNTVIAVCRPPVKTDEEMVEFWKPILEPMPISIPS